MEADYGYDGAGRRIAKLVQTYNLQGGRLDVLLREYVCDGLDVATEYEYHGNATAPDVTSYYWQWRESHPGAQQRQRRRQIYWYAWRAQGSTTALLDTAGQVAAEYQSDELGGC